MRHRAPELEDSAQCVGLDGRSAPTEDHAFALPKKVDENMIPLIEDKFERMGARVKIHKPVAPTRWTQEDRPVVIDIKTDRHGECFDIGVDLQRVSLEVIDLQRDMRHLMLMSRSHEDGAKEKFLCGHDERHWFVAAVPPGNASNVRTAMESLKPPIVIGRQDLLGVRYADRFKRRNAAYIRQGEWFFVPQFGMDVQEAYILRNEPLQRGAGKPHWAQELFRSQGETVYVHSKAPNALTEKEREQFLARNPKARNWKWRVMTRDASVYVRGQVSHPDHAAVYLNGWHLVQLNRETEAPAMRNLAFLD